MASCYYSSWNTDSDTHQLLFAEPLVPGAEGVSLISFVKGVLSTLKSLYFSTPEQMIGQLNKILQQEDLLAKISMTFLSFYPKKSTFSYYICGNHHLWIKTQHSQFSRLDSHQESSVSDSCLTPCFKEHRWQPHSSLLIPSSFLYTDLENNFDKILHSHSLSSCDLFHLIHFINQSPPKDLQEDLYPASYLLIKTTI